MTRQITVNELPCGKVHIKVIEGEVVICENYCANMFAAIQTLKLLFGYRDFFKEVG